MQVTFKDADAAGSLRTLAELEENHEALLDRIDLPQELSHRLMELGFLPGHSISAGRSAPGGDPRVFRIDGTEVALRLETARHIFIHPAGSTRTS